MTPTKAQLEKAINANHVFLQDVLANRTTTNPACVAGDTSACLVGIFLNRLHDYDEATLKSRQLHTKFHYWCSVIVAVNSMGVPVNQELLDALHAQAKQTSDELTTAMHSLTTSA